MKKWWFGEPKHIDQEKIIARRHNKADLRKYIEKGDEQGYRALALELNPNMTEEEMEKLTALFHELRKIHPSEY